LTSAIAQTAPALIPPTRYQGSKRKLTAWLHDHLGVLAFETVLDAFGGSGAVSYLLKAMGKRVVYNDILAANEQIGIALIANDTVTLSRTQLHRILDPVPDRSSQRHTFIRDTFKGIYFTDRENVWLDQTRARIARIRDPFARAIAWYALFQSAIAKRPYNLFHRCNLYMRTADVPRRFGNKRSWDRPFDEHFRVFVDRANAALIDARGACRVTRCDATDVSGRFDLVYADPPYVNRRGVGVDYHHFYHFFEGMLDYSSWCGRIDRTSKHRRLRARPSAWTSARTVTAAFERFFTRFERSIIVVSYRSDGIPSIDALVRLLRRFKPQVTAYTHPRYQYALSTNRSSREVLLVGQ